MKIKISVISIFKMGVGSGEVFNINLQLMKKFIRHVYSLRHVTTNI